MAILLRALYNLLLPVFCLLAAPGWLLKMARRGGLGPRLWERLGAYDRAPEFEPAGGVYVHAVSVGEVMIALKLIARWREEDAGERFVLAATTSTGFQLATERAPEGTRVIYSPVDFPFLISRLLRRFEPRLIVLVESELWPNLLHGAKRRNIPVALANARMSPRSGRRYARFRAVGKPLLTDHLGLICAQADEHAAAWRRAGVPEERIEVAGSVKFDPEGAPMPERRPEFAEMLAAFGAGRPVVLAASTHSGEEVLVARAVRECAGALAVLSPRHAERRREVARDLAAAGFEVVLRSEFAPPADRQRAVLVVDSTGELRDWTAHADVAVIGKSLLARGGQNPVEAIAAGVPVICGPHMENFEPLISQLREAAAVRTVRGEDELRAAIVDLLGNTRERQTLVRAAESVLGRHRGATARTVCRLRELATQQASPARPGGTTSAAAGTSTRARGSTGTADGRGWTQMDGDGRRCTSP